MESLDPSATTGAAVVAAHLDARGVPFELIEHAETFTAAAEAVAARVDPAAAGKTLLLHDRDGYSLVVVPADRHVDLGRVREIVGATAHLRLATEAEMSAELPMYDVGAIPPVGPGVPPIELVDLRLLEAERVLFPAGDHRHSVLIPIRHVLRLAEPRVADICASRDDGKDFWS